MKIPSISELVQSKLFFAGLVVIGVNVWFTYNFYQVNSSKILLVLIGVSIMAVWNDFLFPQNVEKQFPWKQVLIAALPLLATLPGIIWYQGAYNYNFKYELASNLVLLVWISYLYRGVDTKDDLFPFFFLIGIIVIYVGLWAFLEGIGYHPLNWGGIPPVRVKSTFGNINYFAGFLVVLTPLLLTLCLPNRFKDFLSLKTLFPANNKASIFYIVVLLIAVISLILTQTRAAQGATIISLAIVTFFYLLAFIESKYKKRVIIVGITIVIFGLITLLLLFTFKDYLPENRYTKLLFLEGWTPRFAGWIPAINSIKASPFIGFGLGSSYNLYFAFVDPNARLISSEHSYNHVHSEFLEYTQEGGVFGLIVFLVFWSYIAYLLIKTIISEQADPLFKKLAIGIIGGFIGYHIQGAFSVAPRMMVVKLPLFTLIGLTFIIAKLSSEKTPFEINKDPLGKAKSFFPALVILGITWVIFTPWLIRQNQFIKIRNSRPSLANVEKLERMVKRYPDAYALDYLSHLQIQYKRPKQLQVTVDQIDKVLPNYRELGYTKSILAIMQKDLPKAKQIALEFQNRQDRYHKATIFLLMGIAIDTADYSLFMNQFKLLTRRQIFDRRLYYGLDPSEVQIEIKAIDLPFEFEDNSKGLLIKWNEKLVKNIFNTGRSVRARGTYSQKEQNTFASYLSFQFSRHPYFQLKIKEPYKDQGEKAVNQHLRDYFITTQQLNKQSEELTLKHQRELIRTKSSARPALQKKQKYEKEEANKSLAEKQAKHSEYLSERTNWETFLKRKGFASVFVNEVTKIVYPQIKPK